MSDQVGPDPEVIRLLRGTARLRLAQIWQAGQRGEELTGEDERYYRVMLEHEEYHPVWDALEFVFDKEIDIDGVNPLLHVCMHVVIENQLADANPPEVIETLDRLTREGLSRHEAIHAIANAFATVLWDVLKHGRPYDPAAYVRGLRSLSAHQWR